MSLWKGPIRWAEDGSGAPVEVQQAFRSAQAQLGTREQIYRVTRRLESTLGQLNSSMPPATTLIGSQAAVVTSLKTLLSIFGVAIVGTVLLWQQSPQTRISAADKSKKSIPHNAVPIESRSGEMARFDTSLEPQMRETSIRDAVEVRPIERKPSLRPRFTPVPVVKIKLDPEDELRILRRAQDDLIKRPLRALDTTEEHLRDYPTGVFAQEREMIAIEALFKLQRVNQGVSRAKQFLERFGNSTHAPRVRSLLEEGSGAVQPSAQ